jgi:hypothetical protein
MKKKYHLLGILLAITLVINPICAVAANLEYLGGGFFFSSMYGDIYKKNNLYEYFGPPYTEARAYYWDGLGMEMYIQSEIPAQLDTQLSFRIMPGENEKIGDQGTIDFWYNFQAWIDCFFIIEGPAAVNSPLSTPNEISINGIPIVSYYPINGNSWRELRDYPARIGDIISFKLGAVTIGAGDHVYGSGFLIQAGLGLGYFHPTPAPLPGTILLLGAGLGCLALYSRRKLADKK